MKTGDPKGLDVPLVFNPDDGWAYGIGNDWAGQVVEAVSGLSLEEYAQQNIFKPLGMSSSTFFLSEHPDIAGRRAAIAKRPSPDSALTSAPDEAPVDSKLASGGGGLFCTPNDYAKFLVAIIGGNDKILMPDSLKTLFKPQLDDPSYFKAFADGPMHDSVLAEFPKDVPLNYALGGGINVEDVPEKRRKGSMMWSGVTNPRWVRIRRFRYQRPSMLTFVSSGWTQNLELLRRCSRRYYHLGTKSRIPSTASLRRLFIRLSNGSRSGLFNEGWSFGAFLEFSVVRNLAILLRGIFSYVLSCDATEEQRRRVKGHYIDALLMP